MGPLPATKNASTPLQIFLLLFSSAMMESIVNQTKIFAKSKKVDFEFTVEEFQAFIAIHIAMGLLRLPQIKDYWSTSEVLATPWFASIMGRDRFLKILRYLHLVDSSQQKKKHEAGYDPLFKVRPLINDLSVTFSKYYRPDVHLSIDEMMIGTRCRIPFLQYLPKKPTRFGIKVWVISESKTGYVLDFQVYTGATDDVLKDGLGYRVVMDLIEQYQHKAHCLFVDNFYSSPKLFIDLLEKEVYCTGTIRTNRKMFPKELIPNTKMKPGSFRFASAEKPRELLAVYWRDRRDVYVMSTMHNTSASSVLKRSKGSKEKQPIPCPTMIIDYNNYMGGVDLTDQYLSYYSMTTRRTLKWWKKVFWRLLDITIVNSWIIFRTNYPDSPINSHKCFRLQLVEELVQPLLDLIASPNCPPHLHSGKGRKVVSAAKRLVGKHFAYKSTSRGRCAVCGHKKGVSGKGWI